VKKSANISNIGCVQIIYLNPRVWAFGWNGVTLFSVNVGMDQNLKRREAKYFLGTDTIQFWGYQTNQTLFFWWLSLLCNRIIYSIIYAFNMMDSEIGIPHSKYELEHLSRNGACHQSLSQLWEGIIPYDSYPWIIPTTPSSQLCPFLNNYREIYPYSMCCFILHIYII